MDIILPLLIVGVLVVLIFFLKKSKDNDGFNAQGEYDAEPDLGEGYAPKGNPIPDQVHSTERYEDNPVKMQYFDISEFDSKGKGEKGTGVKMRVSTLKMLDAARAKAGIPFVINSGIRTESHNKKVKGKKDSGHLPKFGYAADIAVTNEGQRNIILKALYDVGFRRFGVARTFIHVDNDPNKGGPAIWNYDGFKITYNPLAQTA